MKTRVFQLGIAAILLYGAAVFTACTKEDNPGSGVDSSCIAMIVKNGQIDYWRTDAMPATLHDTITITVAPEHHVLVATNYSASEYAPFRGFLNVGDIHSCEPWLYSECLQKNIRLRAKEWYRRNGQNF